MNIAAMKASIDRAKLMQTRARLRSKSNRRSAKTAATWGGGLLVLAGVVGGLRALARTSTPASPPLAEATNKRKRP